MATTKGKAGYLTLAELSEELGFKRTKLYSLIDLGMPYRSLSPTGRTKRFVLAEVLDWLDNDRKVAKVQDQADDTGKPARGRPRKDATRPPGGTFGNYRGA